MRPGCVPGIDVVYHGESGQLEYDFGLWPGANPAAMHIALTGAQQTLLDSGDLAIHTPRTTLVEHAPVAFQEVRSSAT